MSSEQVGAGKVVTIHYTLTVDGAEVDSSRGQDPLPYLHGAQNIVPGLEKQLDGKSVGDQVEAKVSPAEGYGERQDEAVQIVERGQFPDDFAPEVGMQIMAQTNDDQEVPCWITGLEGDDVTVDFNHPLAGKTLEFAVEIVGVREATKTEEEHGHVHP